MIQQQLCGGYRIPDRFEKKEIILILMSLCVAQDQVQDRKLREELILLENKIFGEDESFIDELDQLLK
jgi:hypothetical protein